MDAMWEANKYTITFEGNGGNTPNPTSKEVTFDDSYGTLATTGKIGYEFIGWYTESSGGTEVDEDTIVKIANNHTLYARWKPIEYNISYMLNGGNGVSDRKYTIETPTFNLPTPTKTGYTFTGWTGDYDLGLSYTTSNYYIAKSRDHIMGNLIKVTPGRKYRVYVTARYEKGPITYLQGGIWYYNPTTGYGYDGYSGGFTKYEDLGNGWGRYYKDVTVPAGKEYGYFYIQLEQEHNEASTIWDFAEMRITESKVIEIPQGSIGNKTFNAEWIPTEYKIKYNLNGGSGVSDRTYNIETPTFSLPTPTRTGYTFDGWILRNNIAPNLTRDNKLKLERGEFIYIGEEFTLIPNSSSSDADMVLFYLYLDLESSDSTQYDPNSYNNKIYLELCPEYGNEILDWAMFTRVDLVNGWRNNVILFRVPKEFRNVPLRLVMRNGHPNTEFNVGGAYIIIKDNPADKNATIPKGSVGDRENTAKWTANTYTVTFDANGGTTPNPTSKSVTYDSTYGTLATTSRTGYTFAGWYTAASGGTKIETTTTVSITSNQTLYAHWTANTYTVTFDANGGTTSNPTSKTVTYASTYGTLATTSRTSYIFEGWYTAASGGTKIETTTTVSITSNQTLYAHWRLATFTVTFNANEGNTPTVASMTVTYGSAYGNLAKTSRTGYTFNGWYTATSGGTKIESTTTVSKASNHTLYAQWSAIVYNITYSLNGGSGISNRTYTIESPDITLPIPTRTMTTFGKVFTGWTGSNGIEAQKSVTIPQGSTGDKSYTANWEKYFIRQELDNTCITVRNSVTFSSDSIRIKYDYINDYGRCGNKIYADAISTDCNLRKDGKRFRFTPIIAAVTPLSGTLQRIRAEQSFSYSVLGGPYSYFKDYIDDCYNTGAKDCEDGWTLDCGYGF